MKNATVVAMPQYPALLNPVLSALKALGGSGTHDEINEKAIGSLNLGQDALEMPRNSDEGNQTEIEYRLAWVRTYLKKYGLIDNSSRGIWTLTSKAESVGEVAPQEILEYSSRKPRDKITVSQDEAGEVVTDDEATNEPQSWRVEIHRPLTRELTPEAFERLVQRMLRESGLIQVEVTGRTEDGGIDGKGIARIHGIMSFHVAFQCKRYQGVVSSSHIRDFRGATVGRADKGLFITTGSFSRDANKEAIRDGAPPIELIDGDQLAEKLKDLRLGIGVEMVERITVDSEWFRGL